jgi:hypothetical protein
MEVKNIKTNHITTITPKVNMSTVKISIVNASKEKMSKDQSVEKNVG